MAVNVLEKFAAVKERIATAAQKSGRPAEAVTLVAVTKGAKLPKLLELQASGQARFAENKVQEAQIKIPQVPGEWHMIGHLQSNKVKDAVDLFAMIQSVDTVRLAGKINEAAVAAGKTVPVLLEVNISGEEQKYGFKPEEVYGAIDEIKELPNVKTVGLMGMAASGDADAARASFKKLKGLFSVCKGIKHDRVQMQHLSMGMSDDFEIAVEEGSTMVRVGRAIFGD